MNNDDNKQDDDKTAITIIVNGRERTWPKSREISFEQVVEIAFPNQPSSSEYSYTVTYSKGDDKKPHGSLVAGESVNAKNGMVLNVTQTNRS
jgi:hypothetical protein